MKEIINYKVYRGPLSPVTEIRKAEIILYDNFLETILDYSFTPFKPEPTEFDYRRQCDMSHKHHISLEFTEVYEEDDIEKRIYPSIYIYDNGRLIRQVGVETMEEAYGIYNKLRNWLLK
jgi:hypothetical protein